MATILVVDDLSTNRAFLVTLLRHHGHRLLEAADGDQALVAIRAERPDLVITDVMMPVMDGYEFVRKLRLDPPTSGIPVVFSTAHYGEREARSLALSGGVGRPDETRRIRRRDRDRRLCARGHIGDAALRSGRNSTVSTCGCSPTRSRRRLAT